ncbi:MAG: hypothetical protein ABIA67_02840 [Candidatus Margulisiibacteriota bacterium]
MGVSLDTVITGLFYSPEITTLPIGDNQVETCCLDSTLCSSPTSIDLMFGELPACSDLSIHPQLFTDYTTAQDEAQLDAAEEALLGLGVNLFSAYYLRPGQSPREARLLTSFWQQLDALPTKPTGVEALRRLTDADLSTEDQRALFGYLTFRSEGILEDFAMQFAKHWHAQANPNEPLTKASTAFFKFLKWYLDTPDRFDQLYVHLVANNPEAFMIDLDQQEIERYVAMGNEAFEEAFFDNFGTADIAASHNLKHLAFLRKTTPEMVVRDYFHRRYPNLNDTEYDLLVDLDFASYKKELFKTTFTHFLRAYYQVPASLRVDYARIVAWLSLSGARWAKVPVKKLKEIQAEVCQQVECTLSSSRSVADMASLRTTGLVEVSPAGLPREVHDLLSQTYLRHDPPMTFFDLLSNINPRIILTPQIPGRGNRLGQKMHFTDLIVVDTRDWDGQHVPAWGMAETILHELGHVTVSRQAAAGWQLCTLPNEMIAFSLGLLFLYSAPAELLPFTATANPASPDGRLTEDDIVRASTGYVDFTVQLTSARYALDTGQKLLGYDGVMLDPKKMAIPPVFAGRPKELARCAPPLDFYPSHPPPDFLDFGADSNQHIEDLEKFLRDHGLLFSTNNPLQCSPENTTIELLFDLLANDGQIVFATLLAGDTVTDGPMVYSETGLSLNFSGETGEEMIESFSDFLWFTAGRQRNYWRDRSAAYALALQGDTYSILPEPGRAEFVSRIGAVDEIDFAEVMGRLIIGGDDYTPESHTQVIKRQLAATISDFQSVIASLPSDSYSTMDFARTCSILRDILRNETALDFYTERSAALWFDPEEGVAIDCALAMYPKIKARAKGDPEAGRILLDAAEIEIEKRVTEDKRLRYTTYTAQQIRKLLYYIKMAPFFNTFKWIHLLPTGTETGRPLLPKAPATINFGDPR